jgi:hypothetical protein
LTGRYFNNRKLEGEPQHVRLDADVDFSWRDGAPADGLPADNFSVRWSGRFGPVPVDGTYQFRTMADDGVRLWIDGKKLIDDWRNHVRPHANVATVNVKKGQTCAVRLEYYEAGGGARCRLAWDLLDPRPEPTENATLRVIDHAGQPVVEKGFQWAPEGSTSRIETGDLPDGDYTAEVHVDGMEEPLTHSFARKHFVWEGNRLGITDRVYPPFEPIQVDEGEVSVVMRRYRQEGMGLWSSVRATANDEGAEYEELLAAPITLRVNGEGELAGEGEFVRAADHEVVYEGRAEHRAVRVRTRCTTEYDGCMRVELTLASASGGEGSTAVDGNRLQSTALESLVLDIPLRDDMVPLWHAVVTGLRQNPAGRTPEGSGRIWDSTQFPEYDWPPDFKPFSFLPYIWLGAEERGFCFFADTDRGWVLRKTNGEYAPCVSLHRRDGVLSLRVHIVQKPVWARCRRPA